MHGLGDDCMWIGYMYLTLRYVNSCHLGYLTPFSSCTDISAARGEEMGVANDCV